MTKGRKPEPRSLRLLKGNTQRRPLRDEPKPQPVAPPCPEWLGEEAKAVWAELSPELERLALLTAVDGPMFAGLCAAAGEFRWANDQIMRRHRGRRVMRIKTQAGSYYQQQRPEVGMMQKSLQLVKSLAGEFGLSPAARMRLTMTGGEEEEECAHGLSPELCEKCAPPEAKGKGK